MAVPSRNGWPPPVMYPDPRGDPGLRNEIAAYLGLARGIQCSPSQVLVTGGFSGALGLAIRGLQLERMGAWIEDPGFPLTRTALGLAGMAVQLSRSIRKDLMSPLVSRPPVERHWQL